jgi:hypothetical protein
MLSRRPTVLQRVRSWRPRSRPARGRRYLVGGAAAVGGLLLAAVPVVVVRLRTGGRTLG